MYRPQCRIIAAEKLFFPVVIILAVILFLGGIRLLKESYIEEVLQNKTFALFAVVIVFETHLIPSFGIFCSHDSLINFIVCSNHIYIYIYYMTQTYYSRGKVQS